MHNNLLNVVAFFLPQRSPHIAYRMNMRSLNQHQYSNKFKNLKSKSLHMDNDKDLYLVQ
jgi:hypothetical protein